MMAERGHGEFMWAMSTSYDTRLIPALHSVLELFEAAKIEARPLNGKTDVEGLACR